MRLVDIYLEETDGSISLLTEGCIQIGNSSSTKSVLSKFYTMSDGSVACYPTSNAREQLTLELECSIKQCVAIQKNIYRGVFLLSGERQGILATDTSSILRAYLTGNVTIEPIYRSAINIVKIPCILDSIRAGYVLQKAPAIYPVGISLSAKEERLTSYETRLLSWNGTKVPVMVRRNSLFTKADHLHLSLHLKRYDESAEKTLINPFAGGALTVSVTGVDSEEIIMEEEEYGAVVITEIPVTTRDNCIDILCENGNMKPLRIRIPVYRQAVIA